MGAQLAVITLELTRPIRPPYINVTDRPTDGQTDGHGGNTALCTTPIVHSCGKNVYSVVYNIAIKYSRSEVKYSLTAVTTNRHLSISRIILYILWYNRLFTTVIKMFKKKKSEKSASGKFVCILSLSESICVVGPLPCCRCFTSLNYDPVRSELYLVRLMLYGLFVPWTIRTMDFSYHGRFVLWTVRTICKIF